MQTLLRSFVCFVCFVGLTATAHAQKNVQKSDATATRDEITADLKFGTGKTGTFLTGSALTLNSGSTLTLNGALAGTPTGGTLNLSALTLTGNLPLNFKPTANDGYNVFVGKNSGNLTLTSGTALEASSNSAFGYGALNNVTTGYVNTAVGKDALAANTTGFSNTALGFRALYTAAGTAKNTALGQLALYSTTTGNGNTAAGSYALYANTTGYGNSALGIDAANWHATGDYNVAVGFQAAYGQSGGTNSGDNNTSLGSYAAYQIDTGALNTSVGYSAAYNVQSGYNNTAVGANALRGVTSGYNNTAVGWEAFSQGNGSGNVGLGLRAGYWETGTNKLFIDNLQRTDEADGRAKALIYGIFDAATANQRLYLNAVVQTGALTTTGVITPSAGIAGVTTVTNGTSGNLGYYAEQTVLSGSAVSLTSTVVSNVTSLNLPAGDFMVSGVVGFTGSGYTLAYVQAGISTTSATLGGVGTAVSQNLGGTILVNQETATPTVRVISASPVTVYLVTRASFASAGLSAYGKITARCVQ